MPKMKMMMNKGIVLYPTNGTTLISFQEITIQWKVPKKKAKRKRLRISYSSDGGDNYTVIFNKLQYSLGEIAWSAPNPITDNGILKFEVLKGMMQKVRKTELVNVKVATTTCKTCNSLDFNYEERESIVYQVTISSSGDVPEFDCCSDRAGTYNLVYDQLLGGGSSCDCGVGVWYSDSSVGSRPDGDDFYASLYLKPKTSTIVAGCFLLNKGLCCGPDPAREELVFKCKGNGFTIHQACCGSNVQYSISITRLS